MGMAVLSKDGQEWDYYSNLLKLSRLFEISVIYYNCFCALIYLVLLMDISLFCLLDHPQMSICALLQESKENVLVAKTEE